MVFFNCHKCGRPLEDRGDYPVVACPGCDAIYPSQTYGMVPGGPGSITYDPMYNSPPAVFDVRERIHRARKTIFFLAGFLFVVLLMIETISLLPATVELTSYFLDHEETHSIIGLPTPGGDVVAVETGSIGMIVCFLGLAAAIVISLVHMMKYGGMDILRSLEMRCREFLLPSGPDHGFPVPVGPNEGGTGQNEGDTGQSEGGTTVSFGRDSNALMTTVSIFTALIFFQVVYLILLAIGSVEYTTPEIDEWERWKQIFALARASVLEEIIFRVLLMGVPLALYFSYARRKRRIKGGTGGKPAWATFSVTREVGDDRDYRDYPDYRDEGLRTTGGSRNPLVEFARDMMGGRSEMGKPETFLVLATATLFGVAHVFLWDWWKVPPTFVAGLGFGYLFVKRGLFPCIALHFAVDYLSIPTLFLAGFAFGIYVLFLALSFLVFILVGLLEFWHYTRRTIERLGRLTGLSANSQDK